MMEIERIDGLWAPKKIKPTARAHALRHVKSVDLACKMAGDPRQVAIQAGGNIGLWPMRMAPHFLAVNTFEPDPISFECMRLNLGSTFPNVFAYGAALGEKKGRVGIAHRSLGSHNVIEGDQVDLLAIDDLVMVNRVALIQLDIEGYELAALKGAEHRIRADKPLIQVELRGFGDKYGFSDRMVRAWLKGCGYREVQALPGNDYLFMHQG